jgi:hypothetical protein
VPDRGTSKLARIDPETGQVIAGASLPIGYSVARAGFGSLWVCEFSGTKVARVDPSVVG